MYHVLTSETAPNIQSGEILIVLNVLASSGLRSHPQQKYSRYLADIDTAKTILQKDLLQEWQVDSGTATKIVLLFNGSSKEFVGNPRDIAQLTVLLTI